MEENNSWNLMMPGNPRYQPKRLIRYFGYDNLYSFVAEVEYAALVELLLLLEKMGRVSGGAADYLDDIGTGHQISLRTTEVDEHERKVTKHDIRAFVQLAQRKMAPDFARYLHIPLTSYDPLDTASSLRFKRSYEQVTRPCIIRILDILCRLAEKYKDTVQIGRTHGQHAVPITIGFWLATIINRITYNWIQLERAADGLVGKISGPVGAYNAYVAMGLEAEMSAEQFEANVLARLGLEPASISTQIVQPEPLTDFLYHNVMLSGSLAQFANDCRHLMRQEIGEIREEYVEGQVGSSTMAHKRNPIIFENICGAWTKNKAELHKVMDTAISEHQRDLTASSVMRDFPVIVINLHTQFDNLLREKAGHTFLERIEIDLDNLQKNFDMNSGVIMAEPLYIALQLYGYKKDAHELVNKKLVPMAKQMDMTLYEALISYAGANDGELESVINSIPNEIVENLCHPETYTGKAASKTERVISEARHFLKIFESDEDRRKFIETL